MLGALEKKLGFEKSTQGLTGGTDPAAAQDRIDLPGDGGGESRFKKVEDSSDGGTGLGFGDARLVHDEFDEFVQWSHLLSKVE